MIPLGNLYCVIVVVYLLQLYPNCSPLLEYINCNSPLKYLLGHPLGYSLGHFLGHPLGHPLGHLLGHPIQAQNCYLYNKA